MFKAFVAGLFALVMSGGTAMAQCSPLPYTLTNGTNADAAQVMANFNALRDCINGLTAPQGRLTLVNLTPVMTTSQTAKTSIFYTPYVGNRIPIYNGTSTQPIVFAQLENKTTDSATGNAGPAAVIADKNYDLFVWNNSGTPTLTRGPAWASDTTRGTGAGTTELQRLSGAGGGILTNMYAITNGPGANLGTYVGTMRSDGSSQINFSFGTVSASGTAAVLGVWNAHNRVDVRGLVGGAGSWSYNSTTIRPVQGTNNIRVSFVHGLQEEFFFAEYAGLVVSTIQTSFGLGLDSTTAFSGRIGLGFGASGVASSAVGASQTQPVGWHFMQALEALQVAGSATFYGDAGIPAYIQTGLNYSGRF